MLSPNRKFFIPISLHLLIQVSLILTTTRRPASELRALQPMENTIFGEFRNDEIRRLSDCRRITSLTELGKNSQTLVSWPNDAYGV